MNRHPLTDDFRMYYNSTYIFLDTEDRGTVCMYVQGVRCIGDDTKLDGMKFVGECYSATRDLGELEIKASQMIDHRLPSAYYQFGDVKKFVTFNVPNRSQKKGLDARQVLLNSSPWSPGGKHLMKMYEQSLTMNSAPGNRDFYVVGNVVNWKGLEVGTMDDAGRLSCNERWKSKEAMLWQLLQTI